ncbi:Restriction endonuclease NaeI [Neorhodopirellula lusitana]|uniref:Restriction endonuclease NaeI n=1 Tax=Neorhodopirellula lusitana TaxID=445327 RepID=A0ABY1PRR0_9BACT|nr:NaeI family type II restriction endonuclease [Neorhodopirellula lusitana]SMP42409.1 Restriction endonuclease NaeI [Neorhodopirellula lusitana]
MDEHAAISSSGGARLRKNRNRFVALVDDPDAKMSNTKRPPATVADEPRSRDHQTVVNWFLAQERVRERFAWSLRDSLDELLDGGRTGRWCYQHLKKTEKTYLGTAIEVNFTKEFDIGDGGHLDWLIDGVDVDCKFSKDFGGWEIPMEMYLCSEHGEQSGSADHVAMLLWMSDDSREWAAGVAVIKDSMLKFNSDGRRQYNRDNKRKLSDEGLKEVHWLWGGLQRDLPENLLLELPVLTRDSILSHKSGQQRVNALFREVQQKIITRAVVSTVAQQDDPMKRARDARKPSQLGQYGFLIIGHQDADPHIATALKLPVPVKGEYVSCRIRKANSVDHPRVCLDGDWWTIAKGGDEIEPAPERKLFEKMTIDELNGC